MPSLEDFARRKLAALSARHLRRELVPTHREDGLHVCRNGRNLLSFSCNDYLGLSHDPRVLASAHAALDTYGAGAGASRLVTGDHPLLGELERRLAAFKGTQAACVFGSGYLANTGILATLMTPRDLILVDELVHSSLWSGTELAGSKVLAFRHNDIGHAAELLQANRAQYMHCTIATEGVFSMDGDRAPVADLAALASAHDAWLLVDDAHAIGVLDEGRGTARGLEVPLQMGTLSKALGSYGGYVCASEAVVDLLKTRARTLVYSTALPPASVAAALAALEIIEREPERVARPLALARRFTRALALPEAQSAIVPIILGDARRTLAVSAALEADGFLVGAIRPPTVPAGTSRLRVTFSAAHGEAEVDALAEAVRRHLPEVS
jgi:8-amino-7-oxononanoate synthase